LQVGVRVEVQVDVPVAIWVAARPIVRVAV
jgi:hypothetical protein